MKTKHLNIISSYLDVNPIMINSALVSAQNRVRYYWTNIPNVVQPKDNDTYLEDIWSGGKEITDIFFTMKIGTMSYLKSRGAVQELSQKNKCLTGGGQNIANSGATNIKIAKSYFKLTPTECERLQTVPDNYTDHVSNSQRYKMLGNGWTVDVIDHIFKSLKTKPSPKVDKPQCLIPWNELQTDITIGCESSQNQSQ